MDNAARLPGSFQQPAAEVGREAFHCVHINPNEFGTRWNASLPVLGFFCANGFGALSLHLQVAMWHRTDQSLESGDRLEKHRGSVGIAELRFHLGYEILDREAVFLAQVIHARPVL